MAGETGVRQQRGGFGGRVTAAVPGIDQHVQIVQSSKTVGVPVEIVDYQQPVAGQHFSGFLQQSEIFIRAVAVTDVGEEQQIGGGAMAGDKGFQLLLIEDIAGVKAHLFRDQAGGGRPTDIRQVAGYPPPFRMPNEKLAQIGAIPGPDVDDSTALRQSCQCVPQFLRPDCGSLGHGILEQFQPPVTFLRWQFADQHPLSFTQHASHLTPILHQGWFEFDNIALAGGACPTQKCPAEA